MKNQICSPYTRTGNTGLYSNNEFKSLVMKVMCVKPFTVVREDLSDAPRPAVGDVDIVTNDRVDENGILFYFLQRFGDKLSYMAKLFATLPEPDADEMKEEEFEAIINLETN